MAQAFLQQLSPSQIVLLRGESFVRGWGKLQLPSGARVSSRAMGEALVRVALLACASQGVLKLQVQPRKALFGLYTVQGLFAEPQGVLVPWPKSTLEAWLTHLALQLCPEERHRVQSLVYVFLRQNSPNPWRQIVSKVQGGLVAMGILEQVEERRLRGLQVVKRKRARVLESMVNPVANLPTDHLRQLLKSCRFGTPQLWRLLHKEVSRGIGYRRKVSEREREDYWHGV